MSSYNFDSNFLTFDNKIYILFVIRLSTGSETFYLRFEGNS